MMEQTHSVTLANSACIHIHAIKYEYACGIFVCLFVLFCFVCLFFLGGEGGGGWAYAIIENPNVDMVNCKDQRKIRIFVVYFHR